MNERPTESSTGERSALVVTNAIKIGGLVLALAEGLSEKPDAVTLALAAFMLAGAQGIETFVKGFFGR